VVVHGKVLAGETLDLTYLVFCMSRVPQRNRQLCQRHVQHPVDILNKDIWK
jgi:hypothetical protein